MSDHHFTPAEVDALIPRLSLLMERAMALHQQAAELQRRLQQEEERIRMSGGGIIDRADWQARAERLNGLGIEIHGLVHEVGELGGVIKDLELGLVDFPGLVPEMMGDDLVNLCWKYGEASVGFWHGFDEGYAQRKPLP